MASRFNYLSPPQLHTLRRAAEPLDEAFGGFGCYLVGSVLTRPDFRDVDVRCIVDDDDFRRLFGAELDQYHGHATALWTSLAVTYSRDLAAQTGLNIDFQIQAKSIANDGTSRHEGHRDALMVPGALSYRGAPAMTAPDTSPAVQGVTAEEWQAVTRAVWKEAGIVIRPTTAIAALEAAAQVRAGHDGEVDGSGCDPFENGYNAGAEINVHRDRIRQLERENDVLRASTANGSSACVYCTLPRSRWAECDHGFPGCPRGDDAMLCPHVGAELETADKFAAALARATQAEERSSGCGACCGGSSPRKL